MRTPQIVLRNDGKTAKHDMSHLKISAQCEIKPKQTEDCAYSLIMRFFKIQCMRLIACVIFSAFSLSATETPLIYLTDQASFTETLAQLKPGDTLKLQSGRWVDIKMRIPVSGTKENPITIEAQDPGKTLITGQSNVQITGNYVVFKDIVFTEGFVPDAEFLLCIGKKGRNPIEPVGCRVTNCAFIAYNPPADDIRYHWVMLNGSQHEVDHCRFEGMNHNGITVQSIIGKETPSHRIHHNYFLDRKQGAAKNGYECVQIGQSYDSMRISRSVIESNIFENCDGETETVSNKSCENTYRNNTFIASAGSLTLRHGNGCLVEGNKFLGKRKVGTAGVRIVGENHIIRNNTFIEIAGAGGGVITLYAGQPNAKLNGYFAAKNIRIEDNILWSNSGNALYLSAGYGTRDRTVLPESILIRGNAFVGAPSFGGVLISGVMSPAIIFDNNLATQSEIGTAPTSGFNWELNKNQIPAFNDSAKLEKILSDEPVVPLHAVGPEWWAK
jgi:poly(beta-D-mannuronate) lyase